MKKLLLLSALFISYSSFSQDYGNNKDAAKLCTVIQSNSFSSDKSADNALDRILSVIGASKNFVLQPCDNINNAIAISVNGVRYILYDKKFMNSLNGGSDWGNLFILAHEVGHHINGHSVDVLLNSASKRSLAQRRKQELEADEFAGFILAKLGGALGDANRIIIKISKNSDDSYSTHPNRNQRLKAVNNGYVSAGYESKIRNKIELNYSLTIENKNISVNKWNNIKTKEKEIQLNDIIDPFERMEIIEDSDIPDLKVTSWVYGRIVENDMGNNFNSPKLVIVQEKFNSNSELDFYNDTSIYIFDSFLIQKLKSIILPKDEKLVTSLLNEGKFKFEYIFDDGTRGKFQSINIENKPWRLILDLEQKKSNNIPNLYQFYQKEYSYFLQKLKTQSKIFIRLIEIDSLFEDTMAQLYKSIDYSKYKRTHEFDLNGASKSLIFN
ncbi:M48 family metalloprotease [Polaribacter sp.]|nr:M48 family metalloprotease [Polaribacter sp.]